MMMKSCRLRRFLVLILIVILLFTQFAPTGNAVALVDDLAIGSVLLMIAMSAGFTISVVDLVANDFASQIGCEFLASDSGSLAADGYDVTIDSDTGKPVYTINADLYNAARAWLLADYVGIGFDASTIPDEASKIDVLSGSYSLPDGPYMFPFTGYSVSYCLVDYGQYGYFLYEPGGWTFWVDGMYDDSAYQPSDGYGFALMFSSRGTNQFGVILSSGVAGGIMSVPSSATTAIVSTYGAVVPGVSWLDVLAGQAVTFKPDIAIPADTAIADVPGLVVPGVVEGVPVDAAVVDTGTVNPDIPIEETAELDFSALTSAASGLTGVFPFCLPWDVAHILTGFEASAVAPSFDLDMPRYSATIDLSAFDTVAAIFRKFALLGWVVTLMFLTKKLAGW